MASSSAPSHSLEGLGFESCKKDIQKILILLSIGTRNALEFQKRFFMQLIYFCENKQKESP